ncbi:hypothetical protein CUP0938 [Campylobacter upsaliensis RM3195]|nr:hypothetical protein CUP0938 [Campylobacter upsaliensis RM3195]
MLILNPYARVSLGENSKRCLKGNLKSLLIRQELSTLET